MDKLGLLGYKNLNTFVPAQTRKLSFDQTLKNIYSIIYSGGGNIFAEKMKGKKIISITYEESRRSIERICASLSRMLGGVPKHSRIGLYMSNSPEWIEIFWAILKIGYKPLLMNTRLDEMRLEKILASGNVSAVISDGKIFSVKTILSTEIFMGGGTNAVEYSEDWEDEVLLMSSGSTDNVKLCVYNGRSFYAHIKNAKYIISENGKIQEHYNNRLKMLAFLPFYHVFGLFACYMWFAFFSRTFVFLSDYSAETIMSTIRRHEVTHIFAVPLLWTKIHKEAMKTINARGKETAKKFAAALAISNKLQDLHLGAGFARLALKEVRQNIFGKSIKYMISGGGTIPPDTLSFFNGIGYHFANGYGMTEVGIVALENSNAPKILSSGSVGETFPSVSFKIGENNELFIKGESIASKLIIGEKETELNDTWYPTGDIARVQNGKYFIDGRIDDLIICENGEKLQPDLAESKMNISGAECFCIIPHNVSGQTRPVLLVELKRMSSQKTALGVKDNAAKEILRLNLSGVISQIYLTTDKLISGDDIKVNRRQIKKLFESGEINIISCDTGSFSIDEKTLDSELLIKLKKCFAEAANISEETISGNSDFFLDLGGTSMDYFTLLSLIKRSFDIKLPPAELPPITTVNSFGEYIKSEI